MRLAVAISYALKRWLALPRYLDDGYLEIDNLIAARYFYSNSGYLMLTGIIEESVRTKFQRFLERASF
jgi:CubicO group peptidase (beta-lactamase class C family)